MRLSLGRLIHEAGLEDVRRDGLCVALWRSGADAWRRGFGMRPLTPQALGSHAVLVAMHPEGMEVVFGEDGTNLLRLAVDSAVLVPTSSNYPLVSRGGDPWLLHREAGTGHQGPEPCAVAVEEDEAAGASAGHEGDTAGDDAERPALEGAARGTKAGPGPSEVDEEVDVKAQVEAALARIMAAAGPPPATEAMEEDDQRRECSKMREAMEENEGLEIPRTKEAHEVEQQEVGVADRAGPKTGEVETCKHWAKRWCMRADACRLAHPQAPVPQGVPQESAPDPPGHRTSGGP